MVIWSQLLCHLIEFGKRCPKTPFRAPCCYFIQISLAKMIKLFNVCTNFPETAIVSIECWGGQDRFRKIINCNRPWKTHGQLCLRWSQQEVPRQSIIANSGLSIRRNGRSFSALRISLLRSLSAGWQAAQKTDQDRTFYVMFMVWTGA